MISMQNLISVEKVDPVDKGVVLAPTDAPNTTRPGEVVVYLNEQGQVVREDDSGARVVEGKGVQLTETDAPNTAPADGGVLHMATDGRLGLTAASSPTEWLLKSADAGLASTSKLLQIHSGTFVGNGGQGENVVDGFGFRPKIIMIQYPTQNTKYAVVDYVRPGATYPDIGYFTGGNPAYFEAVEIFDDGFRFRDGRGGISNAINLTYPFWALG